MSSNNNNNNVSTHVPILDGTNYREWSAQMTAFLQAAGLWLIVNGTITIPTDAAEALKWQISDQQALGNITLRLSHNVRREVGTTSAITWTNLATAFGTIGVSRLYGDFRTLVNFKISGT